MTTSTVYGDPLPRIGTSRNYDYASNGKAVADLALLLGRPLLPWQAHVFDVALEYTWRGNAWRWVHDEICLLTPRQNGKTEIMAMRAFAGLTLFDEPEIVGTAQSRQRALDPWRVVEQYMRSLPTARPILSDVRTGAGIEQIVATTGCRYRIAAMTPTSARGMSVDTLLIDEALALTDESASALMFTTQARPNPQTWIASTAGTARALVLNRYRQRGRTSVEQSNGDSIAYFEYSAPDDCALDDPAALVRANPATGHLFTVERLMNRVRTMPPESVRAEVLTQWSDTEASDDWLPPGRWSECADTGARIPDDDLGRVLFAVDASPDSNAATLAAAYERPDGRVHVELVARRQSSGTAPATTLIESDVSAILTRNRVASVVGERGGPAAPLLDRIAASGVDVHLLDGAKIADACQALREGVLARKVVHRNDPVMSTQVHAANVFKYGDKWRFARRRTSVPIDALMAVTIGHYAATRETYVTPKRASWVAY